VASPTRLRSSPHHQKPNHSHGGTEKPPWGRAVKPRGRTRKPRGPGPQSPLGAGRKSPGPRTEGPHGRGRKDPAAADGRTLRPRTKRPQGCGWTGTRGRTGARGVRTHCPQGCAWTDRRSADGTGASHIPMAVDGTTARARPVRVLPMATTTRQSIRRATPSRPVSASVASVMTNFWCLRVHHRATPSCSVGRCWSCSSGTPRVSRTTSVSNGEIR
jgi:hypothetical protein